MNVFDNTPSLSERSNADLSLNQLRDGLASITHRVGQIELLINKKMDRSECMGIFEKKASCGQLKRSLDELQIRMRDEKNEQAERNVKMQQIAIEKINELGAKLKKTTATKHSKQDSKGANRDVFKRAILPQQLFIESSQTMFSLLIQEIYKLQSKDQQFQKQLELRNKKIIALNNEVCSKIQKLEAQIEEKIKYNSSVTDSKVVGNTWSHIERANNKATVHKCNGESNQFENFRIDMLNKTIEALQKQILNKMNIKDILPLIKQNCQPLSDSLSEVRQYVEQSVQSTKRILSSQTEINKEMSMGVKVAWWHSLGQEHQFAVINKQIINLVPEIVQIGKGSKPNFIKILQNGLYLIKIYPIESSKSFSSEPSSQEGEEQHNDFEVMIDTDVHIWGRQNAIRLQKLSQVRIIQRVNRQIVFSLQKL